jgi:tetratricopeptide (TPR) repeat protein
MKKYLSFSFLFIFIMILFLPKCLFAQELNIIPYLKQIEDGNKTQVESELPELKKNYPSSSNLLFLEGVLTENGQQAVAIYNELVKNYPNSKYADASLYRIYSYYYALGMYGAAKNFLSRLEQGYPNSPYIAIAKKNIPKKDSVVTAGKALSADSALSAKNRNNQQPDENYQYTIQAGAFTVLSNAQSLMKNFEKDGYYSRVEEKSVAGTTFHVVYVGKFSGEDDAANSLKQINAKYNLNGRIVKLN